MAKHTDNQELKRRALNSIGTSREELTIQASQFRHHISPARILQRVASKNATLLTGVALIAVLIPSVLLFRKQRPASLPPTQAMENPTFRSAPKVLIWGALGVLAKSAAPALIKSTILPYILNLLIAKQAKHHPSESPDHSKNQQTR
jgi:hypothetical protein